MAINIFGKAMKNILIVKNLCEAGILISSELLKPAIFKSRICHRFDSYLSVAHCLIVKPVINNRAWALNQQSKAHVE